MWKFKYHVAKIPGMSAYWCGSIWQFGVTGLFNDYTNGKIPQIFQTGGT